MSKTIVCDGNEAAAWGVSKANPDMVAVYPITPQSSLAEYISQFVADGIIAATKGAGAEKGKWVFRPGRGFSKELFLDEQFDDILPRSRAN